ncbi:hypothetical protein ACJX0J_031768 [Zea mays]
MGMLACHDMNIGYLHDVPLLKDALGMSVARNELLNSHGPKLDICLGPQPMVQKIVENSSNIPITWTYHKPYHLGLSKEIHSYKIILMGQKETCFYYAKATNEELERWASLARDLFQEEE